MADGNRSSTRLDIILEATLPAAALLVKGFWESGARLPQPDDFDDVDLGGMWEAILALRARNVALSRINLKRELIDAGWSESKAFEALAAVKADYLNLPEALACAQAMLDRRLRRQAMRVCSETLKELPTVHNVQEVVQRTERAMSDLASQSLEADGWTDFKDVKDTVTERLPTGIDDLDRVTGGLPVAELTIIGGATGMGKSAFASVLALNIAREGYGVAYFSLEMGTAALLNRMAATAAYVHGRTASGRSPNPYYEDFELGRMVNDELKRFLAAREAVKKLAIKADERRGLRLEQIRLGARRAKMAYDRAGIPMKLLIVDHIGKVKPDRFNPNRNDHLGEITETLAVLGAELKVSAVGLSQLKRKDERNPDPRPTLGDLRDSGNIEQDAHTVYLVHRPGRVNDLNKDRGDEPDTETQRRVQRERYAFECDVAKSRGGAIKRVPLFCEIGANAILSWDDKRVPLNRAGFALRFEGDGE